jgi:maltose phosphorylase
MFDKKIDPSWCAVEDTFSLEANRSYESLFALGTGYMTTRSSVDEGFYDDCQSRDFERHMGNTTLETMKAAKSKWGTYIPVIQARHPHLMRGIVNLPYYLGLAVFADGEKLDMEVSRISEYRRWLNFRTATLYRTLAWETKSGKRLRLSFTRFMDPALRFACAQELRIESVSGSARIELLSFVDNDVRTNGYDKFSRTAVGRRGSVLWSDVSTNMGARIVTASSIDCPAAGPWTYATEARWVTAMAAFELAVGASAAAIKLSMVACDAYFPSGELEDVAVETLRRLSGQTFDRLHEAHMRAWARLWEDRKSVV